MIRAIIIEDSRLARVELKQQLSKYPNISIVGEADSYDTALKVIKENEPDLLFLDIHLPGKNGFDILQQLEVVPAVLFTTAFDQYAIQSFDYNTIDYLLKPISDERLKKAIEKVEHTIGTEEKKSGVLTSSNRLFVKDGDQCWFLTVGDIHLLESKGNYTKIFFSKNHPLLLKSLQQMEGILDPALFIRVNRQQIININFIDQVEALYNGKLKLTLKSGQAVEVSRRQVMRMRELYGI